MPSSIYLSLNRKDELLAPSPADTLRSLGVTSGDLIYYSLDQSAFVASGMEDVEKAPSVSKRLSIPFFLKKILLEKCGDTSELTILALSVHAVMLESGFLLLDHHGYDKFSFSKELLSVSLRYSLPELITRKDTNTVESVTVRFQNIDSRVVVYGTLGGSRERVHMTCLDKRRFVPVIDLVLDTLKFEKESSSIYYRDVFRFWRMVKDDLVIPLLFGICDKAGLESPPCLMRLPTELKLKILESLPGVSIGNMACVCTEMRCLASDNDLWKQKFLKEAKDYIIVLAGEVNWKYKFAAFWRRQKRLILLANQPSPPRRSDPPMIRDPRGPRDYRDPRGCRDPFGFFGHRGSKCPKCPRSLRGYKGPKSSRGPRGSRDPSVSFGPRGSRVALSNGDPSDSFDLRGPFDPITNLYFQMKSRNM